MLCSAKLRRQLASHTRANLSSGLASEQKYKSICSWRSARYRGSRSAGSRRQRTTSTRTQCQQKGSSLRQAANDQQKPTTQRHIPASSSQPKQKRERKQENLRHPKHYHASRSVWNSKKCQVHARVEQLRVLQCIGKEPHPQGRTTRLA